MTIKIELSDELETKPGFRRLRIVVYDERLAGRLAGFDVYWQPNDPLDALVRLHGFTTILLEKLSALGTG